MSIAARLRAHDFTPLFIEDLGWDYPSSRTLPLRLLPRGRGARANSGAIVQATAVAQKRGVQVFVLPVDRHTLVDRRGLQHAQSQLYRLAGEHILIALCDAAGGGLGWRRQVWQWMVVRYQSAGPGGTRTSEGPRAAARTVHREHPFFSDQPPPRLLARLEALRVGLHEEDTLTALDASVRIRNALDAKAEKNLFVRSPWYAQEGDRLARLMVQERVRLAALRESAVTDTVMASGQRESRPALNEFLEFHHRLRRKCARWVCRHLPGLEIEDAEQQAWIALRRAAEWFDPERGFQFSTLAVRVLRTDLMRVMPPQRLPVGRSFALYERWRRIDRAVQRWSARYGERGVAAVIKRWRQSPSGKVLREWATHECLRKMLNTAAAPDHGPPRGPWRADGVQIDAIPSPGLPCLEVLCAAEVPELAARALRALDERECRVITERFGLNDEERAATLAEIAECLGVTKERVRQIETKALVAFREEWLALMGDGKRAQNVGPEHLSSVNTPEPPTLWIRAQNRQRLEMLEQRRSVRMIAAAEHAIVLQ
ncbi:hypothetical protein BH11PLA1_BH11PLA1_18450 [soil metagenome]